MRTDNKIERGSRYRRKQQRRREKIIRGIVVTLAAVVLVVVALSFGGNSTPETKTENTTTVSQDNTQTNAPTQAPDNNVTEGKTEVPSEPVQNTPSPQENSAEFEQLIEKAGYSAEDFGFEQLIVVDSYGTTAVLNTFEKVNGAWVKSDALDSVYGYVGEQGVSASASEYASYTPKGLYSLGTAFGICDNPGTSMDYFKVTSDSYWVDDENSAYYNQHVEGTDNKDWTSAEHLIEYSGNYDYCVFIEYNTNPVVSGKGSAFFLHVGQSPTAGCVAISEQNMINTLCWLNKAENPHILIF